MSKDRKEYLKNYNRKYYLEHKEEILKKQKKYQTENKEKVSERHRKYNQKIKASNRILTKLEEWLKEVALLNKTKDRYTAWESCLDKIQELKGDSNE